MITFKVFLEEYRTRKPAKYWKKEDYRQASIEEEIWQALRAVKLSKKALDIVVAHHFFNDNWALIRYMHFKDANVQHDAELLQHTIPAIVEPILKKHFEKVQQSDNFISSVNGENYIKWKIAELKPE